MLPKRRLTTGKPASLLKFIAFSFCGLSITYHLNAAEIYKWVDENGVVTYSQQKPNHTDFHTVTTTGNPPSAERALLEARTALRTAKEELSSEQQENLAELELEEADRVAQEKTRKASNCTLFTELLAQLTAKDRVRAREPDGSERMVPEEERQERITEAQQEIELNCS